MPEISIIVPVYKVEEYLNKCVDSILDQTFRDFELILVDDGSPDNCGAICDEYAKKDDRVLAVHKKNGGLSDARNYGINIAKGKYIGFIDSDDYISKDMYETLYNNLIDNDADVSVCGIYNCYDGNLIPQCKNKIYLKLDGKTALRFVLEGDKFSMHAVNKLYKKSLFIDNNLLYPINKLSEDAFVTPKLLAKANKVVVTTEPKYYYVHRKGSITSSEFKEKDFNVVEAYTNNLKFVEEQYPELKKEAFFRYIWSYMYVLDKMLLSVNFKDEEKLKQVVSLIRKNTFRILSIDCFTFKRKLATLMLLFSLKLYKFVAIKDREKNMRLFDLQQED